MDTENGSPLKLPFNWKGVLAYGLPAVCLAAFLVIQISGRKARAEKNFAQVERSFVSWKKSLDYEGREFADLERALKSHPQLRPHYASQMAQLLLLTDRLEKARTYVGEGSHSDYADYGAISFLISEGNYQEALMRSLQLKERIKEEHPLLTLFNLLRIATLSRQLGEEERERITCLELKERLLKGSVEARRFLDHMNAEGASLIDYIDKRGAMLSD